jgi:hypothetical protein
MKMIIKLGQILKAGPSWLRPAGLPKPRQLELPFRFK